MKNKLPIKFDPELTKISNYYLTLQLKAERKAWHEYMEHEYRILNKKQ